MPKKKGPPYTDDPGCKYIVIEDPWPGNASGKARDQVFFNHLCTWVRFMLGKTAEPEAVYHLNTRDEVIVQLPKEVDIVLVLGRHAWRQFLSHGHARDKDRVSYVFEYDYRSRGEPGNRMGPPRFSQTTLADSRGVSGDPPPHIRFPVIFPYPHVSWASPRGKRCADLALPLPHVRQPTPIPDTSLFEPYQHPTQLTSNTIENAQERTSSEVHHDPSQPRRFAAGKIGKLDPYEQDRIALRALQGDDKPSIVKREPSDVRVKIEGHPGSSTIKREPDLYGPSKEFRSAVERLQRTRAHAQQTPRREEDVKPRIVAEEPPLAPSDAFVEAYNKARSSQSGSAAEDANAKRIKEEEPHETTSRKKFKSEMY
ncbi:hypothetical protein BN946_scf185043.g38 [Trametes cinnabarina]|uniref:Uncharacterized protein n=1 Tax=Pycnoporus cinnabarinus TaxID=5643 RepID=A0A060SP34_PYCCI|nr:hypothetical protein BN946_scf185043.g38 [Trametes cinnabarina]